MMAPAEQVGVTVPLHTSDADADAIAAVQVCKLSAGLQPRAIGFSGQVIVGACVSSRYTVLVHISVLPQSSVAVNVMLRPLLKSQLKAGRLVPSQLVVIDTLLSQASLAAAVAIQAVICPI